MIFCLRERLALLFSGENIYILSPGDGSGGRRRSAVGRGGWEEQKRKMSSEPKTGFFLVFLQFRFLFIIFYLSISFTFYFFLFLLIFF